MSETQIREWSLEEQIKKVLEISTNIATGHSKHEGRISGLEQRVALVENGMTCDSRHQQNINAYAKKCVAQLLVTPKHPDYRSTITALWGDFRQVFGICSYRDVLVADYDRAMNWIKLWRPVRTDGQTG